MSNDQWLMPFVPQYLSRKAPGEIVKLAYNVRPVDVKHILVCIRNYLHGLPLLDHRRRWSMDHACSLLQCYKDEIDSELEPGSPYRETMWDDKRDLSDDDKRAFINKRMDSYDRVILERYRDDLIRQKKEVIGFIAMLQIRPKVYRNWYIQVD